MADLLALIDEFEPFIKDNFLDAVLETQNALEAFILENYPTDSDELPAENPIDQIALSEFETQLSKGFQDNLAALHDKAELPIIFLLDVPKFDTQNLKTEFIKSEIKTISAESKTVIQIAGNSKKRILETVGLTPNQARSLTTYRKALENIAENPNTSAILDSNIIRNLSASQRSVIRQAIAKGLEPEHVDALVNKQRKALLVNRAKAIGASLSSNVAHTAQQTIIDLSISAGLVKPQEYKRFWHTAHDEKVRHTHNQTKAMNADGVALNQPFNTPLGPRMNPPLEINCRCRVSIRKA